MLIWWVVGAILLAGGAILIAVTITRQVIKDLLNSDKPGFKDSTFAKVVEKKLEGEHTVVKVKLSNGEQAEIKSEQGATVSTGETIWYY